MAEQNICCNLSRQCATCCFTCCNKETCRHKCDKEFEGKTASCKHLLLREDRKVD